LPNIENPEEDLVHSDDEDNVAVEKEVIPEQSLDKMAPKKKLGSSDVMEVTKVSTRQYLAPFCSNKYP